MRRDEIRRQLLAGCDRLLSHTLLLGREDRRLIEAQRALYARDDDVVDRLIAILDGVKHCEEVLP